MNKRFFFSDLEKSFLFLYFFRKKEGNRKDVSQMQFYVDYFNKYEKDMYDNNTVGIILCETKDVRVETNEDIYQIKYLNEIPKEQELLKIINENKVILLKTADLKLNEK